MIPAGSTTQNTKVHNMASLHETLAVLSDLSGRAKNILEEAVTTFTKRTEHFSGHNRRFVPFSDDPETLLAAETETTSREMVTTVDDKLRYVFEHLVAYIDAEAQRDATNQVAKADIVIDGVVLLSDVPGTWLLGMEKRLDEWRKAFLTIPTLPPGEKWTVDLTRGANVFTHEIKKVPRTRKTVRHKVLYEATKEHPAQIEKWNEDVPIGAWEQEDWSGMMTPACKSDFLARLDKLINAVVQARMRANSTTVVDVHYGKTIQDFLLDGKLPG